MAARQIWPIWGSSPDVDNGRSGKSQGRPARLRQSCRHGRRAQHSAHFQETCEAGFPREMLGNKEMERVCGLIQTERS